MKKVYRKQKKDLNLSKVYLPSSPKRVQALESIGILAKNLFNSISSSNPNIPSILMIPLQTVLSSSIDILLYIYSSKELEKRLKILTEQINTNLSKVDEKIKIQKEDFKIYWRKAIKSSLESARLEKIELFANTLTNFAIDTDKPFSIKSSVLNDLDFLELEHIKLLKIVYRDELEEDKKQTKEKNYKRSHSYIKPASNELKMPYSDTWKLATELLNRGLVIDPLVGAYGHKEFVSMRLSEYGEYFIKTIKFYKK